MIFYIKNLINALLTTVEDASKIAIMNFLVILRHTGQNMAASDSGSILTIGTLITSKLNYYNQVTFAFILLPVVFWIINIFINYFLDLSSSGLALWPTFCDSLKCPKGSKLHSNFIWF